MTERGEVPDIDLGTELDVDTINDFRDMVLKPAIDNLWPNNSCNNAKVADSFKLEKGVELGGSYTYIRVEASCSQAEETDEADYWADPGTAMEISIAIKEQVDIEQLEPVIVDAISHGPYDLYEGVASGVLNTWKHSIFTFEDDNEDPLRSEYWIEVCDNSSEDDESFMWSILYVNQDPDLVPGVDDMYNSIYLVDPKLTGDSHSILTRLDCYKIDAALVNIGVPQELIDSTSIL